MIIQPISPPTVKTSMTLPSTAHPISGTTELTHLGVIRVTGDDAVTFLQGQLTQDVALMGGNEARLAAFCNAKGRMPSLGGDSSRLPPVTCHLRQSARQKGPENLQAGIWLLFITINCRLGKSLFTYYL